MLEQLPDLPAPIPRFWARGKITAEDYKDVSVPAVAAALEEHEELRTLHILAYLIPGEVKASQWPKKGRLAPGSRGRTRTSRTGSVPELRSINDWELTGVSRRPVASPSRHGCRKDEVLEIIAGL